MFRQTIFLATVVAIISSVAATTCMGSARYRVTFRNLLTNRRFNNTIPAGGLVFSPLAAVSHSNRQSFFTVRGFASQTVEEIAETGNNANYLARARRLRRRGEGVLSVVGADGPTRSGRRTQLMLDVNCDHRFITVIGMIAPSPDWIVQINNVNLYSMRNNKFVHRRSGSLIAYDAGVDDGRQFTNPSDPSLDEPTDPPLNIAPLVEDETDRFDGRIAGRYFIEKVMS